MSGFQERFRKLGTPIMSDAAFRAGVELAVPSAGLLPLDAGTVLAGPAVTVTANNDLVSILEATHQAQAGDVIVIGNSRGEAALMGDLIGAEAVRKELAGFVVDGLVRDTRALVNLGLAVFCRGSIPIGPLKLPAEDRGIGIVGQPVTIGGATLAPGMWVFGDADGVMALHAEDLGPVFAGAEAASRQEEKLAAELALGSSLGEAFQLEAFLARRRRDPGASFNEHLAEIDRAI